jgi:hypothetical protein
MSFSTHSFVGDHLKAQNLYNIDENGTVLNFIGKYPPDVTLMLRVYEVELGKKN